MIPNVSVIIPMYQAEKYIEDTIESVLNQTYRNFEIIIVDDGSTDQGPKLATEMLRDRPEIRSTFVAKMKNDGIARTLNIAIRAAQGQWIKWISADDIMYHECLERLVYYAENQLSPEEARHSIFYSSYDIINETGAIINQFMEPDYRKLDHLQQCQILWNNFYGNGSSTLIHKSLFHRIGLFDESMRYCEDYEFWLRACILYGVELRLVHGKLIQYRYHAEQTTNKVDWSIRDKMKARIKSALSEDLKQHFE